MERHIQLAAQKLNTLLAQPACQLGIFMPAGLHSQSAERHHLDSLAQAGADLFEIGLAHHAPFLDGPLIQSAYRRALQNGHVLEHTVRAVEHAARLRPTIVMTYWEPVRRYGPEHVTGLFADAGAAGVMIVDLPTHLAARWHETASNAGLLTPSLLSRQTPQSGLPKAVAGASGWLYAPASTALTGYQGTLDIPALADFTQHLRAASSLPVVSGVGISSPALAAQVAPLVDAVVIGTPVVRALLMDPGQAPSVAASFAQALHPTHPAEHRV
ncbi:tryptophan synthase subunit alpha [Streptomyces sp. NBC_01102]|uniref:tryptophan synthase subunit alpha n=1 Tax=Streptomyces sp. NBC_01102 TaxID=2903749 RepID=UPI00387017C2|nr:tryptophan synthase subunit alpha [Streptomyces sp. NBC_01102]